MPLPARACTSSLPTRRPPPVTSATRPLSSIALGDATRSARRDALLLLRQPFRGDAHHSEGSSAVGATMPVGPAASNQLELRRQCVESLRVIPTVARMQDLEPIESGCREGG